MKSFQQHTNEQYMLRKKSYVGPIGLPAAVTPGQKSPKLNIGLGLGDPKFIKVEEPAELVEPPSADLNGDGVVDVQDLITILGDWGECPECPGDLNGDGVVDIEDLLILISQWGPVDGGDVPGPEGPEWELNNPEQFRGITNPY